MRMSAHEGPSVDGRARRSSHLPQAAYERLSIPAIIHHLAFLGPPHHHMMHGPRRIQSSLPRHLSFTTSFSRASARRPLRTVPESRSKGSLGQQLPASGPLPSGKPWLSVGSKRPNRRPTGKPLSTCAGWASSCRRRAVRGNGRATWRSSEPSTLARVRSWKSWTRGTTSRL